MKGHITLLVTCIAFSCTTIAQIPATFQTRQYTTENGLPSNGTKGIEWDEETGFLWVATEAGIVRFNGIDFKSYTNKNTPFIGSERFRLITRNNKGNIYAADEYENIYKVRQNELVLYHKTNKENKLNTYRAYYGIPVSDTFFYYKVNHPPVKPFFPNSEIPKTLPLTDTSVLFIDKGRPVVITLTNDEPAPLVSENVFIKQAFKIKDQVFFVSKDGEVYRVDIIAHHLVPVKFDEPFENEINKGEFYFFPNGGEKNVIAIKNNKAWSLSYNGAMIIAEEICDVLPANIPISHIQYSHEKKLLFIGTDSKGLFVISENRVNVVKKKQSVIGETDAYYSQIELPGNRIMTDRSDILGPEENISPSSPIKDDFYNSYLTSDSLLWYNKRVNNDSNLYCYNYKTGATKEYNKITVHEHFGFSFSNGKIYIANYEGLGVLQDDSLHYLFSSKERNWSTPYAMAELSRGVFAVSNCQLYRCNTLTGIADTLLDLADNCVRALWKYKDYLFIGTYGKGYFIYRNGKMKAMPLDKNNFLLYVHGFIADKYGYCWMSTNRGLFKSSLADLLNAFEHNGDRIYYHYLGRNDGMDITEMNGSFAPPVLQMQDQTISFPTMDGLLWVNPEKAVPVLPGGNIYIDGIQADNKKIDPDSLTKGFRPDTKEIIIQLGFSAWCNKENLYIDYDLNNSGHWKPVNINNEAIIRLLGLEPGDYNLRIRKMNGFGSANYSYNEFHFHIKTPWYQQWWFIVLIALLAVGIGRLYIKLRTRQYALQQRKLEKQVFEKTKELQQKNELLEKNDTIKTRLISIISHDIITPLKFLTVAGKNLLQKKQMMSEEMQNETISEITNTSQELQLLSTNILNWIKYQNENRRLVKETFNVHELINQVLGVLASLAKQKQLHLSNEVDKELALFQYAEPLRILIYNLVANAINFSDKGSIVISNRQEPGNLIISVKDEGTGMTTEQVNNIMGDQVVITSARLDSRKGHGLGYLIIKDLIKMIGAEIVINSEKGKGTIVSIRIPSE
jgi:signal transduction histidine kinase